MADLQIIGAVGIRVRPDTKGFREETRREVMAQLRDVEGDAKVEVNPQIVYSAADIKKAFKDAFKGVDLDQTVNVKAKLNDDEFHRQVRKLSRAKVPNLTAIRVEADTKSAQEAISKLTEELEELAVNTKRMPDDLKRLNEDMANSFKALAESQDDAGKSLENYSGDLTETTRKIKKHSEIIEEQRKTELNALTDLASARAEAQRKLEELQARRDDVAAISNRAADKEAKDAARRLRELAVEEEKAARQRVTQVTSYLREVRQGLAAEEAELNKLTKARDNLNKKVSQQKTILKDLKATEDDRRKGYTEEKEQLEEALRLSKERTEEAKKQLALEKGREKALSLSAEDLRKGLSKLTSSYQLYSSQVRKGLTDAASYTDWVKQANKELTGQQLANLEELDKRREESHKRQTQMAKTDARLAKQLAKNLDAGWDDDAAVSHFDRQLNEAKAFADEAKAYIESRRPRLEAHMAVNGPSLAITEGVLAHAARDRKASIFPEVVRSDLILADVDRDFELPIRARLKNVGELTAQIAQVFAGVATARAMSRELRDALQNFDKIAVSAGTTAVAIGALSAATISSFGLASTLADDLTELVGVALLTPAAMTTLATAVYTTMKGFDLFGAAVDGDAEALETFNASGRRAARLLGELKTALNERVKPSFWRGMEDDLERLAEAIAPGGPVLSGMVEAAHHVGAAWGGIFRSLTKFAESGDMGDAFRNMEEGLRGVANATEPLFDGINRIGLAGSRFLPNFGQWAQRNAETFRDWANEAERTGKMDFWIERSLDHLYSLASITGSSVRLIDQLGRAAENAGFGGLAGLAFNLREVADAASRPFFQGNASTIFAGSLDAIRSVGRGLGDLGKAVLEQSDWIADSLESLGRTTENIFSAMAESFDNPRFLEGGTRFFESLEKSSERLGPVMDKIANGLGDSAALVGAMVDGVLRVADAFLTIWDNSDGLTQALEEMVPWVSEAVAGFIELTHVPIIFLVESLGALIGYVNDLPEPLRLAAAAMALLVFNSGKIKALENAFGNFRYGMRNMIGEVGGLRNTWATAMATMSSSGRDFLTTSKMLDGQTRAVARTAFAWRDSSANMKKAVDQVKQSFRAAGPDAEQAGRRVGAGFFGGIKAGLRNDGIVEAAARSFRPIEKQAEETSRKTQGIFREMNIALRSAMGRDLGARGFDGLPMQLQSSVRYVDELEKSTRNLHTTMAGIRTGAFVSGLGAMAGAAKNAGAAIGLTVGSGLRMAMNGLVGAMGGPWGLALMAGVTALSAMGVAAARERQKIEALRQTFDEFGESTTDTTKQLANNINDMKRGFFSASLTSMFDGFETGGEMLKKFGLTSQEVADMLVNDRPKYDKLSEAFANVAKDGPVGANAVKFLSQELGVSASVIEQNAGNLRNLGLDLQGVAGDVDAAKDSWTNLNGTMSPVSQGTQDLADAFGVMADEAAGADEKLRALNDALDILNGGQKDVTEASIDFYDKMRDNDQVVAQMRETYGDFSRVLNDDGSIKVAAEGASALSDAFKGLVDPAQVSAQAIADAGGTYEEVLQPLAEAEAAWIRQAEVLGLTEEEALRVWESLKGANPEEIATLLTVEGQDSIAEAERVMRTLGLEFDNKRYLAWLEANPDNAKLAAEDATAAVEKFVNEEYLADLGVDKTAYDLAMVEAEERGVKWDAAEFTAWLKADKANAELAATDAAAAARQFATDTYVAKLDAEDKTPEAVALADAGLDAAWEGTAFSALLGADDDTAAGLAQAKGAVESQWLGTAFDSMLGASDNSHQGVMLATNTLDESWRGTVFNTMLGGQDNTAVGVGQARGALASAWQSARFDASLGADPALVDQAIAAAMLIGGTWDQQQYTAALAGDETLMAQGRAAAEQHGIVFDGQTYTSDLAGNTQPMANAKGQAEGLGQVFDAQTYTSDLSGNTAPMSEADRRARGLGSLFDAQTYTSDLDGNTNPMRNADSEARGVGGQFSQQIFEADFTASSSGVWAALRDAWSAARQWAGQVFSAVFSGGSASANGNILVSHALKPLQFANGGLINAMGRLAQVFANGGMTGVQTFASGGITMQQIQRELKRKGGWEDHRARINTPRTPFRIHSEPETGGESYIPLAVSKRPRSTRIWEETGNRLGVNIEQYAAGGIHAGKINGDPDAPGAGGGGGSKGSGVNINVVNNYPQAEPTSVTTNRSLQLAASLL